VSKTLQAESTDLQAGRQKELCVQKHRDEEKRRKKVVDKSPGRPQVQEILLWVWLDNTCTEFTILKVSFPPCT
jgi:hypothetical protein